VIAENYGNFEIFNQRIRAGNRIYAVSGSLNCYDTIRELIVISSKFYVLLSVFKIKTFLLNDWCGIENGKM